MSVGKPCPICGTPSCACGGPTTNRPVDEDLYGAPIMSSEFFTATERLYLTADGKRAVKGDDPARHELLVVEGGTLPMARARELGLVGDVAPREAPPSPTKEGPAAPAPARGRDR